MTAAMPLRLGMAMWSHPHWQSSVYGSSCPSPERLARYAQVFSSVEGNTSFYATPLKAVAAQWAAAVPESFRFTFKLPQLITHQRQLRDCRDEVTTFFDAMTPLMATTGMWQIQLPATFGPEALPQLQAFLPLLPRGLTLGVEVRHPAFFAKGDAERQLNRLLHQQQINRIIMDSRPVFAATADNEVIRDAQRKKPRVPVHAIATAAQPVIRFIGQLDLDTSEQMFTPWLAKLADWLNGGYQPYLFVHTPDNIAAPQLAARLWQRLSDYRQAQGATALTPFRLADSHKPQLNLFS
ncbi:DUF72 domain-containing protein [Shewanella yunxiaonensis]|nr:DUF72 domain-containing protein [Shewanella yunxiaonensis]